MVNRLFKLRRKDDHQPPKHDERYTHTLTCHRESYLQPARLLRFKQCVLLNLKLLCGGLCAVYLKAALKADFQALQGVNVKVLGLCCVCHKAPL